ncbi:MAG: enoyl-CoA hydratase/isomerase family protein [Thermoanaerobaculia bacterium]
MADDVPGRGGSGEELLVEARGAVRILTLNRPEAFNAANPALHRRLARIWPELAADADVAAIVLTGAGKAFSGEGDLDLLHGTRRCRTPPPARSSGRAW